MGKDLAPSGNASASPTHVRGLRRVARGFRAWRQYGVSGAAHCVLALRMCIDSEPAHILVAYYDFFPPGLFVLVRRHIIYKFIHTFTHRVCESLSLSANAFQDPKKNGQLEASIKRVL